VPVAIPYFNVQFTHVRGDGGACETMTYLGRCQAMDVRLAQRFDFRHLGGDLVHSEIMRTEGVSEAFDDLEYLANSIDEAEVYRLRGDIDNRLRQTQNGAVLVLALPPASEMTLTEATELTKRIARLIAGDRRLAIHIAIHDPAMMQPGARNRHAHLFFPRREIEYDQLVGPAIRDLFARPMQISAGGHAVTVEGNRWPDFYRRQLQTHFAEFGIELVVDPIAPFPGRHWKTEIKLDDPRVQRNRSRIWRLNVQAIHDDPVWLVGKLLRGQSTIRIAELQRLLDRFIDHEGQRQHILENILSRPDIVTLAADPTAEKPRFVTTAEVCNSVQRACELVDRAAVAEGPAICTITAASHAAAVERFDELLGRAGFERPLLVGNNHSECRDLSNAIQDSRPKVTTIKRALSDLSKMVFPDRPSAKSRAQNRLIIVPRAESVEDQTLAKLILAAHERGTPLVLLHDQSKRNGIVSHRLAAYAADRLASVAAVDDESYAEAVERLFRSGLVGPAIQLIAQRQDIGFKAVDHPSDEDTGFDFIVCNDPRRVEGLNEAIRSLRLRQGKLQAPTQLSHPLKPVWLSPGEKIVFTRDDCSVRPPRIRAGEVAQILEIDSRRNAIRVELPDGDIETVQLAGFTHFRPAHAIHIREARNLDRRHSLCIEVSDPHHVWAALILAVCYPRAILVIDPRVATDIPSFIAATQRSLPAALSHQLTLRSDRNAEMIAILNGNKSTPPLESPFELEQMPEPAGPKSAGRTESPPETVEPERFPEPAPTIRIKSPPMVPLHERVRAILDFNAQVRRGVDLLREKLSHNNPEQSANAEHVLNLWGGDSLMTAVIRSLQRARPSEEENSMNNLDLPPEIEHLSPREWSDWELYRLRIDLAVLQFDFAYRPITLNSPDSSDDSVVREEIRREIGPGGGLTT
jgi:hypothetical protein